MNPRRMTVSVIQITAVDDDNQANVDKLCALLDVAGQRGSDLVVLPEVMTGSGASDPKAYRRIAEKIPGETTRRLAEKARCYSMCVVGSMFEEGEGGLIYNSAPLIGPDGEILFNYRKTHLFSPGNGPDIAAGIGEPGKIEPGNSLFVVETPKCKLGVATCADLRFHEVFRELSLMGAEVVALPTAFPSPRLDHWEFTLRTRATDNQLFIAATGLYGREPKSNAQFVGRSMIVDPWGVIAATAPDAECCTTIEIDLDRIRQVRDWYPLTELRRPEIYVEQRRQFQMY
ncbi:carbon-nitrogen hydrolase family protein [Agrobacterium sp. NPDC089420]|uniref:carbon-nitrogen hydrolase family protein n=1 Tax=Agrobacterium sp. NPDC089420 TaxID=3363918 RepID=UPI00384CADD9